MPSLPDAPWTSIARTSVILLTVAALGACVGYASGDQPGARAKTELAGVYPGGGAEALRRTSGGYAMVAGPAATYRGRAIAGSETTSVTDLGQPGAQIVTRIATKRDAQGGDLRVISTSTQRPDQPQSASAQSSLEPLLVPLERERIVPVAEKPAAAPTPPIGRSQEARSVTATSAPRDLPLVDGAQITVDHIERDWQAGSRSERAAAVTLPAARSRMIPMPKAEQLTLPEPPGPPRVIAGPGYTPDIPAPTIAPLPSDFTVDAAAELHVVSGHEARDIDGPVLVTVNRPGQRAVLVLSSTRAVEWQINATAGTSIDTVLVAGVETPVVRTGIEAPVYRPELPAAELVGSPKFLLLLSEVTKLTGTRPQTVSVASRLPKRLVVEGPVMADASTFNQLDAPPPTIPFRLYSMTGSISEWSSEPEAVETPEPRQWAHAWGISRDGARAFELLPGGPDLVEYSRTPGLPDQAGFLETDRVPVTAQYGPVQSMTDTTYAEDRDLVGSVVEGVAGRFLVQYSLGLERWLPAIPLREPVVAISWNQRRQHYVAISKRSVPLIQAISPDGDVVFEFSTDPRNRDLTEVVRPTEPGHAIDLLPFGRYVVLVQYEAIVGPVQIAAAQSAGRGMRVAGLWVIDLDTEAVYKTQP